MTAALALAGAVVLSSLQRHRSALFPPMDFALDVGDIIEVVDIEEEDRAVRCARCDQFKSVCNCEKEVNNG